MVRQVDRHSGCFFTGSDGPFRDYLVCLHVNHCHFVGIFDIVVDTACLEIHLCKFRFSTQRNCGDDFARFSIKHRCRLTETVERVYFLDTGDVQDCIGIRARIHLHLGSKSLEVHNAGLVLSAITRESQSQVRRYGKAMDSGSIGYLADNRVRIEIDHYYLGCVCDIKPAGDGVDRGVIPSAFSPDVDFGDEMIRTFRSLSMVGRKYSEK